MSLRVCVLASGSSGNCTYVASPNTAVLIDAGLSCRQIDQRLNWIGAELSTVRGICLSHEHEDHKSSLAALHRRTGQPLYANSGTIKAIERGTKGQELKWNVFSTGSAFTIGELTMEPFSVPHDSYDPVGFVVSLGSVRVGIVTDMGMSTGLIRERLRGCTVVIIESNHDELMLRDAVRPWSLKQRIASRQGHLSNSQAAELIGEIALPELKVVVLAHLSSDCNRPELAMESARKALETCGRSDVHVKLTYPDKASDVVEC